MKSKTSGKRPQKPGKGASKQQLASGIAVHCRYDEIVPAESLKLYEGNYKQHPAAQLDRYETVVVGNGYRRAVVVSRLSGMVTKGNGMVMMARRRGWSVPVEYQDYQTTGEEIRDLVADNALAELATKDDDALRKLLEQLGGDDVKLAGVTAEEFEKLLADVDVPEGQFPITAKLHESYDYVVIMTDNASDFVFLQTLCAVGPERSYKKTGVGLGRVVPFKRFLESLHANRHSINVPGRNNDQSPSAAGGSGGGATKPARGVRREDTKRRAKDRAPKSIRGKKAASADAP